ncbi:MAG: glycosyltransferase family 4 protein [Candidatus Methylomirabilota bacterium]
MITGTPRVVYSSSSSLGGVGLALEAYQVVLASWQQGWLKKAVVYGNRQSEIPRRYVRSIRLHPGKLLSFTPARYYYGMKMEYVDWVASRIVARGCDLYHGWANEAFRSIRAAKQGGAVALVEIPGPDFRSALRLTADDARRRGVSVSILPRYALGKLEYFVDRYRRMADEYNLADRIIAPSLFSRDTFLQEGIPPEKVIVIPRGVDIEKFRPAASSSSRFRAIFVGSLCYRKGLHYLLEAWTQLALPDAELLLVGNVHGEIAPLVNQHAGKHGVRLLGQTDPLPLYQQASVFVFPSLIEGSAKVTYEAMACGLPVIVTPNAGSVARDGVEGYLVPAQDAATLAERILDLYRHPERRRQMGAAARRRAEAHTWAHHRRHVVAAYAGVLGLSGSLGEPPGTGA